MAGYGSGQSRGQHVGLEYNRESDLFRSGIRGLHVWQEAGAVPAHGHRRYSYGLFVFRLQYGSAVRHRGRADRGLVLLKGLAQLPQRSA